MGSQQKPKVLIFTLDNTLWPFALEERRFTPPFSKKFYSSKVKDKDGQKVKYFKEAPIIFKSLTKNGYKLALASRTSEVDEANQLLKLFKWDKYFAHKEIFPGPKVKHVTNIKNQMGVEYKDIVFFDNDEKTVKEVGSLGVHAIYLQNGINEQVVKEALETYQKANPEN